MKRHVTAVLIAANVLMLLLLAWLWVDPSGGLRDVHWQPPAAIKPDLGSLSATSLAREDAEVGRFVAILDRPLFYPGRRPAPVAKSGPAQADPLDSVQLLGMFRGSEGGAALVRVDGKSRRVKLSESLGDWSLKEIRIRDVVFARGAETRVVALVQAKQATAGAAAQPGNTAGFMRPDSGPGASTGGTLTAAQMRLGMNFGAPAARPPTTAGADPGAPTFPSRPIGGNAAAPAPSNAKPATPSSNPFVTGAGR